MLKNFKVFVKLQVHFLGLCLSVSVSTLGIRNVGPEQNVAPCLLMNECLSFLFLFWFEYWDIREKWGRGGGVEKRGMSAPSYLTVWKLNCSPFQTTPLTPMLSSQERGRRKQKSLSKGRLFVLHLRLSVV